MWYWFIEKDGITLTSSPSATPLTSLPTEFRSGRRRRDPRNPLKASKTTLHGAACHGCLLVAETSCEARNLFLDRALMVDTVGQAGAVFFQQAIIQSGSYRRGFAATAKNGPRLLKRIIDAGVRELARTDRSEMPVQVAPTR